MTEFSAPASVTAVPATTSATATSAVSADLPAASTGLDLAVIGAGPVGLALALRAARRLPPALLARLTVYDALPADKDVSGDPRTLALSLGSVQELERLGVWPQIAGQAAAIAQVHVSQLQPALLGLLDPTRRLSDLLGSEPAVRIHAHEMGVAQLGAVSSYGAIVAPLRAAWQQLVLAQPARLQSRFGVKVAALDTQGEAEAAWLQLDGGERVRHDLVIVAEGGVFADQARKAVSHDYGQTAWVGTVELEGGTPGVAYERFTPQGPAALLPLPGSAGSGRLRAALVWCIERGEDPVAGLAPEQIASVLTEVFGGHPGRVVAASALKGFSLGLNAERRLVQGRSVRIGNAAQTLHPVGGQGLNLGLRDAAVLVDRLATLRQPRPQDGPATAPLRRQLTTLLRQLDLQRAPDRWGLILATDFLARSFTWSAPGLATLRGAGLGLIQRAGPLRRSLARTMMFGLR
ncbi:MAG: hypothetical protein RL722_2899 [Pseudomonadota bacterium]|jgi:2-octaprenyl-6-methoxyphenol hydroxylase